MDFEPNNTTTNAVSLGLLSPGGLTQGSTQLTSLGHTIESGRGFGGGPDPVDILRFQTLATQAVTQVKARFDWFKTPDKLSQGGVYGETQVFRIAPGDHMFGDTVTYTLKFGYDARSDELTPAYTSYSNALLAFVNALSNAPAQTRTFQLESDLRQIITLFDKVAEIYEEDGVNRNGVDVGRSLKFMIDSTRFMTAEGEATRSVFLSFADIYSRWEQVVATRSVNSGPEEGLGPFFDIEAILSMSQSFSEGYVVCSGYSTIWKANGSDTDTQEIVATPNSNLTIISYTGLIANKVTIGPGIILDEGNSGSTSFSFTIHVENTPQVPITVSYNLAGTGARPADSADFVSGMSGTVLIAAGQNTAQIVVQVAGDTSVEDTEFFEVRLTGTSPGLPNVTLGQTVAATGTILNDDTGMATMPVLSIAAASPSREEGNNVTTPFAFNVTRAGSTAGAVSVGWRVDFATSLASAADFVGATSGTLLFAAGQTMRTIQLDVLGDLITETDESFNVVLHTPNGATISSGVAAGYIRNDDPGTIPAPVFTDGDDIIQLTSSGGAWDALGGADQVRGTAGADVIRGGNGADTLLGMDGFDTLLGDGGVLPSDNALAVKRLYLATLGRGPDEAGWKGWTAELDASRPLGDIAPGFIGSPEFQAKYGNLDNTQFITLLYQNVLHRAPDAAGLQGWLSNLNGGATRTSVVTGFSESNEFKIATDAALNYGQVYRLYGATLGRQPDSAGLKDWVANIGNGQGFESVAAGFVGSPEFQAKYGSLSDTGFVTLLYQNVLGRGASQPEIDSWLAELNGGKSRTQVVLGFSESAEYIARTKPALQTFMLTGNVQWNDGIEGGLGDDHLAGGIGADNFTFRATQGGNDQIYDWEPWDYLLLGGFGYTTRDQVYAKMTEVADDVIFSDQGQTITFHHTKIAEISNIPL